MASCSEPSPSRSVGGGSNDENDPIRTYTEMLRVHMGLPRQPGGSPPRFSPDIPAVFFIERAPPSNNGSRCKLPTCTTGSISPGQYRIAVTPSMNSVSFMYGRRGTADFYHLRCFEMIADFSQISYLQRISSVAASTFNVRGISPTSRLGRSYVLDCGAERLLLQWKIERGRQIDERDGTPIPDQPALAQDFAEILDRAGEPGFEPQKPEDMGLGEFFTLITMLAPNESEGPEDDEVWNLFEEFLCTRNPGSLDERHDLSNMLEYWQCCVIVAINDESNLNTAQLEMKEKLGPKAIKALQRLSRIPMIDIQSIYSRRAAR